MRKSNVFDVTIVNCRNELIDALKRKDVVIVFGDGCGGDGDNINDFYGEFSSGKTLKSLKKTGIIATIGLPGVGAALGVGALAVGSIGTLINDTSNYQLAEFEDGVSKKHIILINTKKYDGKLDVIKGYEQYSFIGKKMWTSSGRCPKCNQKIRKAEMSTPKLIVCSKCNAKLVICKND